MVSKKSMFIIGKFIFILSFLLSLIAIAPQAYGIEIFELIKTTQTNSSEKTTDAGQELGQNFTVNSTMTFIYNISVSTHSTSQLVNILIRNMSGNNENSERITICTSQNTTISGSGTPAYWNFSFSPKCNVTSFQNRNLSIAMHTYASDDTLRFQGSPRAEYLQGMGWGKNIITQDNMDVIIWGERKNQPVFIETGLSIRECPKTLATSLILALFIIIALSLLAMALSFNNAILGIFGSLCLIMASLYISPCGIGFGVLLMGLGIILIVIFAFMSLKGSK